MYLMKYIIFIIIFIVLLYLFVINKNKRYLYYLPTISILYPNSYIEVNKVIYQSNNRNSQDIKYFYYTDTSVLNLFKDYVNEPKYILKKILRSQNNKITLLKKILNRPRPYQISTKVKLLKSVTADTPAFPAGHAAQAYILASYLKKKYPLKSRLFESIADICADCRVKAGLHYPSDGYYSKLLFFK